MNTILSGVASNIPKMYMLRIIRGSLIFIPFVVLFFLDLGLSMTQVFLLQSIFAGAIVLLEIPTGYLGDMLRRKDSLIIGCVLRSIGRLLYYVATGFWTLVIAHLILAASFAFCSGSDTAMIYDTLLALGKEDEFKKIKGRYLAFGSFSEAGGAIVGGLLIAYGFDLLILTQFFIALGGVIVTSMLVEPERERFEVVHTGWKHLMGVIKYALYTHNSISSLVIFSAITGMSTMFWVWMSQPYWESMEIPLIRFGILRSAGNLSVGIFSRLTHYITKSVSNKTLLLLFPVIVCIVYALFGTFAFPLILICMLGLYAVRGVSDVVYFDMFNKLITSKERATVLSLKSLAFSGLFMIIGPITGIVADAYSIQTAFYACALITALFATGGIYLLYKNGVITRNT